MWQSGWTRITQRETDTPQQFIVEHRGTVGSDNMRHITFCRNRNVFGHMIYILLLSKMRKRKIPNDLLKNLKSPLLSNIHYIHHHPTQDEITSAIFSFVLVHSYFVNQLASQPANQYTMNTICSYKAEFIKNIHEASRFNFTFSCMWAYITPLSFRINSTELVLYLYEANNGKILESFDMPTFCYGHWWYHFHNIPF